MFSFKEIFTFAYESEYDSAYDLSEKRLFSKPKIYTANGNLNKRWYIYFSFRHPETGKLKRLTPFYGKANQYKTKEERLEVLTVYRKALLKLLKLGYNSFEDNSALYEKLNKRKKIQKSEDALSKRTQEKISEGHDEKQVEDQMSIKDAFQFGLKLKDKVVSKRTSKDYENKVGSLVNSSLQSTPRHARLIDDQ